MKIIGGDIMDDLRFYTVEETAEILSISIQSVRKLIKNKKLYAVRIGHVYRIPYETLKSLILYK